MNKKDIAKLMSQGRGGYQIEGDEKRKRTAWISDGWKSQSAIHYGKGKVAYDFPESLPKRVRRKVQKFFIKRDIAPKKTEYQGKDGEDTRLKLDRAERKRDEYRDRFHK